MSYSRPPPNVGDLISLKVDNLTDRISQRTLGRIFEKYGPIGDVYVPRDRFTQESRGFAFVRFQDRRHAEEAVAALDGVMLDGRVLRVQMARHGRRLYVPPGRSQGTPPQSQEGQSHSLRLGCCRRPSARSRSPSQARSHFSCSQSPSRSCDSSPSSSRASSPSSSRASSPSSSRASSPSSSRASSPSSSRASSPGSTKSSSESSSSSATTSRSRSRSLPPGRKYRS